MASDTSAIRAAPRPKLSAHVAATLRTQLIAGEIPPGAQLATELALTHEFGVSRTVVREALAILAADGLVEARQGAGVFAVRHPSSAFGALAAEMGSRVSSALNVLEVRLGIEIESAALAAERHSPSQQAAIHEAFFEFERLLRIDEPTGPADFAFHRAIAVATGNPFYVEILDALGQRAIPCDVTSPFSTELTQDRQYQVQLQREHRTILDAIAARDADAARVAMRRHLGGSRDRYQARLTERAAFYETAAEDQA